VRPPSETRLTAGLRIRQCSLGEAVAHVASLARERRPSDIHFITAHAVSIAAENSHYKEVMDQAEILLPASRWLEILTALSSAPLTQVRGPDFFRALLESQDSPSLTHFFVAPSSTVLSELLIAIRREFPSARVAGGMVAPHGPLTQAEIDDLARRAAQADNAIVWLGIGTPAQNFLARQLVCSGAGVVVGVGAAFEFVAGLKKEAPRWLSVIGLEWLFRLFTEPRRLWRRYTFGNAKFLIEFVRGEWRTTRS
jgi:N-acetylglucosaminyldiphosphoundecaprenol N-acetyl-beta-D-mannosaminyltransferase